MNSNTEELPDNLKVVTNLLTLAFHRYLVRKQGKSPQKGLELISNVSTTTFDLNNLIRNSRYGGGRILPLA